MKLFLLSLFLIYSQFIVNRIEAQKCENEILINNVKVPSTFDLVGLGFGLGFKPGKSIQFVGTIKSGSSCIKLANPGEILKDADVVFHFSPRPGLLGLLKHIERNSWSKRTGWTRVDSSGGWPIKPNNNFEMEWVAGPNNAINVYIDKKFFTKYDKWDTSKVAQLNIVDAIAISSIKLCGGKPDPTPPPPTCENPILIDKVVRNILNF
uniref:Galectin n=1 Tax=Meloidogyne enterolobii TaxID=390850 RepID=A0A6V7W1I3_MELEN|nr:unnamed protein product [Meloidogyne enterolobii]